MGEAEIAGDRLGRGPPAMASMRVSIIGMDAVIPVVVATPVNHQPPVRDGVDRGMLGA